MKIFSFFSGVGMLDLGFQEAGFDIVFVNEYKQEFLDSYIYARRIKYPDPPEFGYHVGDINQFLKGEGISEVKEYIKTLQNENETIGFIGGPPCPDFSVGGKNRGRNGENGKLAQSYINTIVEFHPDFFVFENVKGLIKTQKHKEYFEELKMQLIKKGYVLSEYLLNALSFGVPQDRDRIVMIGVAKDSRLANKIIFVNNSFAFPWLSNLPYDADAVKQLVWPGRQKFVAHSNYRICHFDIPKELTVEHWFRQNDVYHHVNGKDVFKVKSGMRKINEIDEGDTSRKSFKRLHRWRYSPTAAYGNNEVHLHPYRARRISVAEAMAIQSIPRWFELPRDVSLTAKFKMVGNGVPYQLSYLIAIKIKDYFDD